MHVTIMGRRWNVVHVPRSGMRLHTSDQLIDGECDDPREKNKQIRIFKGLTGADELDTLLHEMLHAGRWELSEEAVERMASDMARALWRLGYRKQAEPEHARQDGT